MSEESDIRHGRHCVFRIHVHLVFVTRYRRDVFAKEALDDLRPTFAGVCADFDAERVEFDGEDDHVHSPIHQTAEDAALNGKSKDGYAVRAILPRSEARGLPRN